MLQGAASTATPGRRPKRRRSTRQMPLPTSQQPRSKQRLVMLTLIREIVSLHESFHQNQSPAAPVQTAPSNTFTLDVHEIHAISRLKWHRALKCTQSAGTSGVGPSGIVQIAFGSVTRMALPNGSVTHTALPNVLCIFHAFCIAVEAG